MSTGDAWWLRGAARAVQPLRRTGMCGAWLAPESVAPQGATLRLTQDGASWRGVAQCGHIWDCPACSASLRAERRTDIENAVLEIGGIWQMLTLTLKHHAAMDLEATHTILMAAWRRVRKQRAIAEWWTENVKASVRSTEITHGRSGWHPHVHVLLAVRRAPSTEFRELLEVEWEAAVKAEARAYAHDRARKPTKPGRLVADSYDVRPWRDPDALAEAYCPEPGIGTKWSRPRDAKDAATAAMYATKMALEASGEGKRGSVSPWSILETCARAHRAKHYDARAMGLWREYVFATRGKRAIELDDRAKRAAKKRADVAAAAQRAALEVFGEDATAVQDAPLAGRFEEVSISRDEFRKLRALERVWPHLLRLVCETAKSLDSPRAALDYWLSVVPGQRYFDEMRPPWMPAPE